MSSRVLVVGSLNVDVVLGVARLPRRGETIPVTDLGTGLGGKGANQAVAAALAGADVLMVCAVGADAAGQQAVEQLRAHGVGVDLVQEVTAPTGQAQILVEDGTGENVVLLAVGANAHLSVDEVPWAAGDVLVVQLEAVPEQMAGLLERARAAGVRTVLNAAPAGPAAAPALPHADVLVVNEVEAEDLAAALVGHEGTVVLTLGAEGARVSGPSGSWAVPAPPVTPVDTTGAGDCFVGWLAAGLALHGDLRRAVAEAVAAASDSTTRLGASQSYRARADE